MGKHWAAVSIWTLISVGAGLAVIDCAGGVRIFFGILTILSVLNLTDSVHALQK
jgi:hypothetical protein